MSDRTFTIDHHGGDAEHRVAVGDVLLKPRTVYLVTAIREVESKLWPDRWKVTTEPMMPRREWDRMSHAQRIAILDRLLAVAGRVPQVIELRAYERGTQPGQPGHERCESPTCEGCT